MKKEIFYTVRPRSRGCCGCCFLGVHCRVLKMFGIYRQFKTFFMSFFIALGLLTVLLFMKNNEEEAYRRTFNSRRCNRCNENEELEELEQIQPINLLHVLTTAADTRYIPEMLKTILHYRSSPVFLHVFVFDELTERIIITLLSTWQANRVIYKIYKLPKTEVSENGIEMLELFRNYLPNFVSKGMYVNQVLFLSDVTDWMIKSGMLLKDNHALSDIPLCDSSSVCNGKPNLMFVNVKKMSSNSNNKSTIINKVGLLPCHLSPFGIFHNKSGQIDRCSSSSTLTMDKVAVVNKNDFLNEKYVEDSLYMTIKESIMSIVSGQPKLHYVGSKTSNKNFEFFLSILNQTADLNYRIMRSTSIVNKAEIDSQPKSNAECQVFLNIAHLIRRTHIFFHCGSTLLKKLSDETEPFKIKKNSTKEIDVTLITVLTLDRFAALEETLSRWEGPAAFLIHLSDSEAAYKLPKLLSDSKIFRDKSIKNRIAIHLVYKRLPFNPINFLRNVVLNNTWTSHVLYIDVDFVINKAAYKNILTHLKIPTDEMGSKKLYLVPAFISSVSLNEDFPDDKIKLLKLIKEEKIAGYGQKNGWSLGHAPTNFKKWMNATAPYQAIFKDAFEPYVVVPRNLESFFNENLLERMGDKVAYVRLLHGMGYDFHVLPNDFMIHFPHSKSPGQNLYYTEPNLFRCGSVIFERFRTELYKRFPKRKF